ncbi:MAG: hypothetical protein WC700_03785 [Gemmatimonadaceae bacterium]|jgi:hypothetical protein
MEWHLARFASLAWAIDVAVHTPRRLVEVERWKRRQTPTALSRFERRVYSQDGEDGAIAEIFTRIGDGNRFSVELGIGDGRECCTRNLLQHHQWCGVLVEADETAADHARQLYRHLPGVRILPRCVTAENVLSVLEAAGVPQSPDLLVIDIDGNDYWVWERILSAYQPRVTVIEYNARWRPPREWVMPYAPDHCWRGTAYFSASLSSLAKLGARSGHLLVGCSSNGVNAYFVRADLVDDRFPDHSRGASFLYAPPRYSRGYGHPLRERSPITG